MTKNLVLAGFLALALMLTLGCGPDAGVDDGDGGKLLSGEEEQVVAWITELSAIGERMNEIDPMSGDEAGREAALDAIDRIIDLEPPRIRDAEANQAFQDIYTAMSSAMEFMKELLEEMPDSDDPQAMMAFSTQMMQRMQDMAELEQQMESAGARVQAIIEVDFADNQEVLSLFREMNAGM